MEQYEILGTIFRSGKHLGWFISTQVLMILAIVGTYYLSQKINKCDRKKFFSTDNTIFFYIAFLHLKIGISAYFKTNNGTINNETWSGDCIWYNLSMFGIYILFCQLHKWISMLIVKKEKTL